MPFTPFAKGYDPRRGKGGRPVEHPLKGKVAKEIWDAMVMLSRMKYEEAEEYVKSPKCKTLERTAWDYITKHTTEFMDRFIQRIPLKTEVTGAEGESLMPMAVVYPLDFSKWKPEQIDKFIDNTGSK